MILKNNVTLCSCEVRVRVGLGSSPQVPGRVAALGREHEPLPFPGADLPHDLVQVQVVEQPVRRQHDDVPYICMYVCMYVYRLVSQTAPYTRTRLYEQVG